MPPPDESWSGKQAPSAPVLNFTSNFPVPSPMKISGDRVTNWEFFRQQWQDYELGTGLEHRPEPVRLATLRSVMGKDCLEIFLNLELTPEERASVTSSLKALEAYFKPKTNVVYKRFLFNSATQSSEEGIDKFVNQLRKMASSCKYGTLTDETIRDRIVIGVRDKASKLRLLKEDELDLNKALSICRSNEAASKQLKFMKQEEIQTDEQVNAVDSQAKRLDKRHKQKKDAKYGKNGKATKGAKKNCSRCGATKQHRKEECKAYGQTCHLCSKPNHFASVCRFKNKPAGGKTVSRGHKSVKQVTEETDTSNDSDDDLTDDEDPLFKIEEVSSVKTAGKQLNAKIIFSDTEELYNTELECQLDTGATCNVMSLRDLAVISQTGDPPLRSSKVKLKLFDGSLMKPSGVATLKIHRDNKTQELDFQIVETVNKPLLSAETCVKLGLLKLSLTGTAQVNSMGTEPVKSSVPLTREKILADYKDVFEGLGHIGESSTCDSTKGSQGEDCRVGEERHHSKGYRPHRLDQQYGHRVQARKDKNLSRPPRFEQGNPET